MKIKEMINQLQAVEKKYGNIEVVMASDSEGNSYSTIDTNIQYSKVLENERKFVDTFSAGAISNNPHDAITEFMKNADVIGVCIFPFVEGFETAEEAVKYKRAK